MRVHYLQHVPFEGLGNMEEWFQKRGAEITSTRFYQPLDETNRLPQLEQLDFLVIMGGPMSVNDEAELPWLVQEKAFVRSVVAADKPVLGVCLGAQLIASSLGAKVFPNSDKEIGWWPVSGVEERELVPGFRFPDSAHVFHWHGETFELPPGARLMVSSEGCVNQGFVIDGKVVGLQFHLETTELSARNLVENCRNELVDGTYIQSEKDILAAGPQTYQTISGVMAELLSALSAMT